MGELGRNQFILAPMIRMIPSMSARHAKDYFSDALSKSDYYTSDQELPGFWQGKVAERIGLSGLATKEAFFALAENRNPVTGGRLTPRTDEKRTVGYDINFHCPKSVSILHAFAEDNHILDAFRDSVTETMQVLENDMKTRVWRKSGNKRICEDKPSDGLVWGHFVHQTARPVEDQLPDPHLHAHCFTFNATWNEQEQKIKAGQFRDIKRDMPYYQVRFQMTLASKLEALGYAVRRTEKSFEIEGVPRGVIDLFSKRTDEIGRVAKEKGITDAKALGELGARTRSRKQKSVSMAELKSAWLAQIQHQRAATDAELSAPVRNTPKPKETLLTALECVDFAIEHEFVRASVMSEHKLLESALRHALGSGLKPEVIEEALRMDDRLIRVQDGGRTVCTTQEVLREEKRMVSLAKGGRGAMIPLYKTAPKLTLKGQQATAVEHVLTTANRFSIIMGAAGSGKTTLMQEAIPKIEATGRKVIIVAPSTEASRGVLRGEGFTEANTVASLLKDKTRQDDLKGQVLWVDEAGLLGTKETLALLELAKKQDARIIFGGDTRQHASVSRGDALRILNTVGGIRAAEVNKIYRQRDKAYREAVEDLAKGSIRSGFDKLDNIGAIVEVDGMNPTEQLVADYMKAVKDKKTALIVCPTHKQGQVITDAIRQRLRQERKLGKREVLAQQLKNRNLTDAEKSDLRNFEAGQVVQFNQNAKGFTRGSQWTVEMSNNGKPRLRSGTETASIPTQQGDRFEVFTLQDLALAKGDKVRITREGFDQNKKRLTNEQILEVKMITKKGITLHNPKSKSIFTVPLTYGHLAHGHCITSQASQGKTIDLVFIYQPASTFPATDAKQFYVCMSRAKELARLYTDSKAELLQYISDLGDRISALELVSKKILKLDFAMMRQRAEIKKKQDLKNKDRDHELDR